MLCWAIFIPYEFVSILWEYWLHIVLSFDGCLPKVFFDGGDVVDGWLYNLQWNFEHDIMLTTHSVVLHSNTLHVLIWEWGFIITETKSILHWIDSVINPMKHTIHIDYIKCMTKKRLSCVVIVTDSNMIEFINIALWLLESLQRRHLR